MSLFTRGPGNVQSSNFTAPRPRPESISSDEALLEIEGTGTGSGGPYPECFPISDDDVLVAVMGATGSGKTTFINMASESNLRIGRGLESCTNVVQTAAPFVLNGRRVILIDTPGFDDTQKSDTEVLQMIAVHLSTAYENGKKLSGVIYFHRISDFRVGGISRRNFKMFRELCGDDNLKNVLIVTNMWGEVDPQVGLAREKELSSKDIFFKPALDKGAQFFRHDNTMESAYNIIRQVMKNHPVTLKIQEELVDQKKDLSETAAGIELNKELHKQAERHRKEIVELQKEMREAIKAKDEETRQELEIETRKLQQQMERIQKDSGTLAENYNLEKAKMEAHMKEMTEAARREAEKAAGSHKQQMAMLEQQLRNTEASMTRERHEHQARLDGLEKTKMEAHMKEMAGEVARREAEKATGVLEQQLRNSEASTTREREHQAWRLDGLEKAKMEAHMKEMIEAARREAEKAAESHKQQMGELEQQVRNTEASMTRERREHEARLKELQSRKRCVVQ